MGVVAWTFSSVLAAGNVLAIVWLVGGLRASDAARVRKWSKRAALTLVAAVGATLAVTAVLTATLFAGIDQGAPGERAERLAGGISEMLNCAAAGVVLSVVPAVAWVVLAVRHRRVRARART